MLNSFNVKSIGIAATALAHHRIEQLVGPGKGLAPAKDFVIAVDAASNGLTTSPSNSMAQPGVHRSTLPLGTTPSTLVVIAPSLRAASARLKSCSFIFKPECGPRQDGRAQRQPVYP